MAIYYNVEVKQEVWWVQSLMKVWFLLEQKNDMHVYATLQKL